MGSPIPATLTGLLRSGTSARVIGASAQITGCDHAIVHSVHGDEACVSPKPMPYESTVPVYLLPAADLVLDLDNATSRAHLAWWILAQPEMAERHPSHTLAGHFVADIRRAADACERGWPVSAAQLDILTTVARRLAGLESV